MNILRAAKLLSLFIFIFATILYAYQLTILDRKITLYKQMIFEVQARDLKQNERISSVEAALTPSPTPTKAVKR